jgi:photosystem II stability/assembly factor-like uncharacterized protein
MRLITILLLSLILPGLLFSQNQWIQTSNLSSGSDNVRALSENGIGTTIAYSWAVGIYKTTDNGISWQQASYSGPRVFHLDCSPEGDFYALANSNSSSTIHRSTNGGNTWTQVYFVSSTNNFASGGGIVFSDSGYIMAALSYTHGPTIGDIACRLLKSTDGGATWSLFRLINGGGFVNDIEEGSQGRLFAATSLSGVITSTDGGWSWGPTSFAPYTASVEIREDEVFIGSGSFSTDPKVFRSTDNGISWIPMGLAGSPAVETMHIDRDGNIFISMDNKTVHTSTNGGINWNSFSTGLPSTQMVYSITGDLNDYLFAGTASSGAFRYGDKISNISINSSIPENFKLEQNFPNPFNPNTLIKFSLPSHGKVKLEFFDILGNRVSSGINKELSAGDYSYDFDGSGLSSGVYFYKLGFDGISHIKKMTLVK